ncbi:MAG TPA: 2OG-Fe(II) oxygenase [Abditibacteriaceae bacterium]|nr:2OG-Fe(II) oxygenase [Abditibacteriaceae bacterium]
MQLQTVVPNQIFTIANFFSPEERARYIEQSEGAGYEEAAVGTRFGQETRKDVRNNERLILDDENLAEELWQRLVPFAPSPLWKRNAVGLNERLRFYRYDAGQTFKPHQDGSVKRENGEKSQVTFMVYLNDDFEGGAMRFFLRAPHGEINIVPQTGMALLFLHTLQHEGAIVESGRKYVVRSDVMYSALPEAS